MYLHSLIPNSEGIFMAKEEIWLQCIKEMYKFCITNELKHS